MVKKDYKLLNISSRYLLILVASLGNLFIFYKLFTKPTIFVSRTILSVLGETTYIGSYIIFNKIVMEVAPACVAGAAYFLLFALALSIPFKFFQRLKLIAYLFLIFFSVNVLRIVLMGLLLQTSFFDNVHLILWNVFSTIFLILIWFSAVKLFKIKDIPVYTDFSTIKNSKNSKTRK